MIRVLITRPRRQADDFAAKLTAAGFAPVFFPVIEIQPIENNTSLEKALAKLNSYAWVVFTSVNGVEVVFERYAGHLPAGRLEPKFAAIGPRTAEALRARGVIPDFVPDEFVAEAILPGMGDLRGKHILLPRAEIARDALPRAVKAAGGIPDEIPVYRTLRAEIDPASARALDEGVGVITLTSPSTVRALIEILRERGLDPLRLKGNPVYACIGPITAEAASEEGLENMIVAEEFTTDGLVNAIRKISTNVEDV